MALAGLLGQEDDATLLAGLDTNGLDDVLISISVVRRLFDYVCDRGRYVKRTLSSTRPSYCAKLVNGHVSENTGTHLALEGVLQVERVARERNTASLRPLHKGRATLLLDDFPDQVGRKRGHCCGCVCRLSRSASMSIWCGRNSKLRLCPRFREGAIGSGRTRCPRARSPADDG